MGCRVTHQPWQWFLWYEQQAVVPQPHSQKDWDRGVAVAFGEEKLPVLPLYLGCHILLSTESLQGMPLPPNSCVLIAQIIMEIGLNQDSDWNFCENLDQNPHGRANWEPTALVLWWHSCKGLSLFPYRTFPRTTNPPSCKAPNQSLLLKMMHPDRPQWSTDFPSKNHQVNLANSSFLQECDLLVFVYSKPRTSQLCRELFSFHLLPATKV